MKTSFLLATLLGIIAVSPLHGQSTRVDWYNSPTTLLGGFFGSPLKAGTIADYDGTRLQLGYYTQATLVNPFSGDWIPLTGYIGDPFPSTIGDKGNRGAGRFDISDTFVIGSPLDLPDSSIPMSIRFYDSIDPAGSVFFNAVSNTTGAWNWIAPSTPQSVVNMSLMDAGLKWQGGAGSAFETTINVIPEPSSVSLLFLGLALIARRSKFRQN